MRKKLLIWITFIGGLFYFAMYFLPEESGIRNANTPASQIDMVIAGLAIGLGTLNLLRAHYNRIALRRPGYYNSIALALGLFLMAFVQIYLFHSRKTPVAPGEQFPNATFTFIFETQRILFKSFFQGLNATIFSLLAFYMASAAYRAFRIKSLEAGIMMVVAVLVMLGQISFGAGAITYGIPADSFLGNFRLEIIRNWIMDNWNTAAQRGILFGIYIGSLAMTLRIWLSLEAGSFFEDV